MVIRGTNGRDELVETPDRDEIRSLVGSDQVSGRDAEEQEAADSDLTPAIAGFADLGCPYWQAKAGLDLGRWLLQAGRPQDASGMLEEARDAFGRLCARPVLEQTGALLAPLDRQGTA